MIEPYAILGVAVDAEFEAIRAAYRRQVRENHPDVAIDKELATDKMALINQAWLLLGSPEKRGNYDALIRLQSVDKAVQLAAEEKVRLEAQRMARMEHQRVVSMPSRSRSSRTSKLRSAKPSSHSGEKRRENRNESLRKVSRSKNPARDLRALQKVAMAAQLFHRDGKLDEAITVCREVLMANGRNVQARELLGDIYAFQGRLETALMMFDQAIQIAPQDRMLRRKRDKLEVRQARPGSQVVAHKPVPRLSLLGRLRARFCGTAK